MCLLFREYAGNFQNRYFLSVFRKMYTKKVKSILNLLEILPSRMSKQSATKTQFHTLLSKEQRYPLVEDGRNSSQPV